MESLYITPNGSTYSVYLSFASDLSRYLGSDGIDHSCITRNGMDLAIFCGVYDGVLEKNQVMSDFCGFSVHGPCIIMRSKIHDTEGEYVEKQVPFGVTEWEALLEKEKEEKQKQKQSDAC